jgi:hypothetical protein
MKASTPNLSAPRASSSASASAERPGVRRTSGAFGSPSACEKLQRTGALQDAGALFVSCMTLCLLLSSNGHAQEPQKKTDAPVPFPKLEHFAALWERSIFTTKDLPSPDAPTGPNFADNLSLSGIYEIDGGVVAVLVDRTTSLVMEARIGSENEMGIKIRAVKPGVSVDKTRIQLQKGDQAGWVSFGDAVQPAEIVQRAVIPTQQGRNMNAAPARSGLPPNPILPPPSTPIPGGAVRPVTPRNNDIPMPPQ